jgi:hypothetical protein
MLNPDVQSSPKRPVVYAVLAIARSVRLWVHTMRIDWWVDLPVGTRLASGSDYNDMDLSTTYSYSEYPIDMFPSPEDRTHRTDVDRFQCSFCSGDEHAIVALEVVVPTYRI